MSKQTAANFFILPLSVTESAELYQGLLRGIGSYQQLGNRLMRLAEQAHAFQQFDAVREYAQILSRIPIKHYQAIGHYYLAVAANSKGNGDQDEAKRLFELAIDTAPDVYKVKGILSLGALSYNRNDFDSALYHYREAIKVAKMSVTSIQAIRGVSILKAIEGNHAQAVKDLESVLPVIRYAPAHFHFDLLNSYAVELGEMGRKDEARNIMRAVLASPFAFAYPEWRDTAEELREANRSFVAVSPSRYNVLTMPEREPGEQRAFEPRPARVLDLAKWKKQMVKKSNGDESDLDTANMTGQDMAMRLLELITENRGDEKQMRKILDYALKVFSEPHKPS